MSSAGQVRLIQRDLLDDLREAIGRGREQGLQTFDQHLFDLFESKCISVEEAIRHADSRTDLTLRIKLGHGGVGDNGNLHLLHDI